MQRRVFLLGGLAIAAAPDSFASAQAGWFLLGTRIINWSMSRDSIMVTRNRQPVSALSFRTRGGDIMISDVEVFFARGRSERFPMRSRIRSHSRSNVIHLRTRDREVRRVEFVYRKPARRMSTTLELFGRR